MIEIKAGEFIKADEISHEFSSELYPCYGGNGLRGYTRTFTNEGEYNLIGRQGALCGNVHLVNGKFHATEHALVVYPLVSLNQKFLHYLLVSMNLNQYATGNAQPGLSVKNLTHLPIYIPEIGEQNKIAIQIAEYEAEIAKLEQNLQSLPARKQAVLEKYLN